MYEILRTNSEAFSQLLCDVGYDCFFAKVEAFLEGDPSYRSRYRPHIIGDDTKQAKTTAKCMEYLTRLFCPSNGRTLPCYNLVVLMATFGDTKYEIPLDIRLWLPKHHPEHISKPQMMKAMIEALQAEAERRSISFDGVYFSCDAAYQRSNALMKTVADTGLTIIAKVSGNLNFFIDGQIHKAKNIRDNIPWSKMKQNNKLGWRYRYKRIIAVNPVLGKVLLIVSAFYDEKHDKYRRILLITTDLDMRAPSAIWAYKLRWRVEIFFKNMKQQLRLGVFQLRKLQSVRSHFQLRGLGYLLLSQVRRFGFLHGSRWSLRKVKRWLRDVLTAQPALIPA
ncbi:MAG: transposase [Candidatus Thorarchaeota archaeon]